MQLGVPAVPGAGGGLDPPGLPALLDGLVEGGDAEVAEGADDGAFVGYDVSLLGVAGQGPHGCGLPVAAYGPHSGEGEPGKGVQQRVPDDPAEERYPGDERDGGVERGQHVADVVVCPREHDAEDEEDARAADGAHGDGLGGADGELEQLHAAAVAGLPEDVGALFPVACDVLEAAGLGGAHHPFVAGGGAGVPAAAGEDAGAAEDVGAVADGEAVGGVGAGLDDDAAQGVDADPGPGSGRVGAG